MLSAPRNAAAAPSFHRPTRGAIRLNALRLDPEPLQADVRRLEHTVQWTPQKDGEHWAQITLLKNEFRHPALKACPAIDRAIAALPSRPLDACLKLLGPGASSMSTATSPGRRRWGCTPDRADRDRPRRRVRGERQATVPASGRSVDPGHVLSTPCRQQVGRTAGAPRRLPGARSLASSATAKARRLGSPARRRILAPVCGQGARTHGGTTTPIPARPVRCAAADPVEVDAAMAVRANRSRP